MVFWLGEDRSLARARIAVRSRRAVIWPESEHRRLQGGCDNQGIASLRLGTRQRAGRQLYGGVRAQRKRDAPRFEAAPYAHDAPVPPHECDVDRKSHEKGMN